MEMNDQGARCLMSAVCLMAIKDWRKASQKLRVLNHKQLQKGPYNAVEKLAKNPLLYLSETEKKQKIKCQRVIAECEEFFDSPMFVEMTGVSGKEEAIRKIRFISSARLEPSKRRKRNHEQHVPDRDHHRTPDLYFSE